jgi:dihydropteroate synthase type 2
MKPEIVGIVNITDDSFSDGTLDVDAAIAHGERLLADGADWLDLGAESSNPAGVGVPAEVEVRRLMPLIHYFRGRIRLSVDTVKPTVMAAALDAGVEMINDVSGGADSASYQVLRDHSHARWVLMHARNRGARAERVDHGATDVLDAVEAFVEERMRTCGVAPERLILDPGMGFFLGSGPEPSLAVLRGLPWLSALGFPLYVGVSRKSFLGALTSRAVHERGAATLAAELWAAEQGVAYLRTHDVRALADALTVWSALRR